MVFPYLHQGLSSDFEHFLSQYFRTKLQLLKKSEWALEPLWCCELSWKLNLQKGCREVKKRYVRNPSQLSKPNGLQWDYRIETRYFSLSSVVISKIKPAVHFQTIASVINLPFIILRSPSWAAQFTARGSLASPKHHSIIVQLANKAQWIEMILFEW